MRKRRYTSNSLLLLLLLLKHLKALEIGFHLDSKSIFDFAVLKFFYIAALWFLDFIFCISQFELNKSNYKMMVTAESAAPTHFNTHLWSPSCSID